MGNTLVLLVSTRRTVKNLSLQRLLQGVRGLKFSLDDRPPLVRMFVHESLVEVLAEVLAELPSPAYLHCKRDPF